MTSPSEARLEMLADPEALSRARRGLDARSWRAAKDGAFAVALSGGSTPRRLYQLLAGPPYRDKFPWSRTHWFWGDERFVPHDDTLSNYRMVREALLSRAPIPAANIHPIPTEGITPEEAASAYERELKSFYGAERLDPARPLFDVTLLGLGPDGHTASLFPGTAVLAERDRWVAAVVGAKPEARITLTYPALESSRQRGLPGRGEEKRAHLARLRRGDDSLPAARLHPTGTLWIFGDAAAAGASHDVAAIMPNRTARSARRPREPSRKSRTVWSSGWAADRPPHSRSKPLAARIAKGLRVVGIPTSEDDGRLGAAARRAAHELCRASPYRSDHRRRRRGRARHAQSDQGARRRAAARKDRGERQRSDDRRRRRDEAGGPFRPKYAASRREQSLSGGRPRSTAWRRSAASRDCAWPETSLSRRTAATTSSIAPSPRYRIRRRWKPVFLPSSALSRAVSLSAWHPRLSSVGRVAWR